MNVWFVALQEIIQNADDAGATKVSFLLDSRPNFFGKNSLYEPSLAKFQGPALYAQNNALFEEEDWENLERLMRSSKKDDPLKVGRFGIGFNSVYHMTGKYNDQCLSDTSLPGKASKYHQVFQILSHTSWSHYWCLFTYTIPSFPPLLYVRMYFKLGLFIGGRRWRAVSNSFARFFTTK